MYLRINIYSDDIYVYNMLLYIAKADEESSNRGHICTLLFKLSIKNVWWDVCVYYIGNF